MSAIAPQRLALGGAQFGLDYGISNAKGRTSDQEARAILKTAAQTGVDCLDTAPSYGDSEERLGKLLPEGRFRCVSKTPVLGQARLSEEDVERALSSVRRSIEKLQIPALHGVLVHHASDLLAAGGDRLFDGLRRLKDRGLVGRIGVSAYDAAELDAVTSLFPIEIVQVPLSLVDQRLARSGHLARLKARGVEIHVRSAFLQGALLMAPDALPPALQPLRARLQTLDRASGGDRLRACLSYLGSLPEIDRVICGVNSDAQWKEILRTAKGPPLKIDYGPFACEDVAVLNPSKWRRAEAA